MKVCAVCNETFENGKIYSNHVRWKHREIKYTTCAFCSESIPAHSFWLHEGKCKSDLKNQIHCLFCSALFGPKSKDQKYCSRSCRAKHTNPGKTYPKGNKKPSRCFECGVGIIVSNHCNERVFCINCKIKRRTTKQCKCVVCGKEFTNIGNIRKTCSEECKRKNFSNKARNNPNCGGETNYKRYEYKNIVFDSSWEVEIAKYLDSKNIKWERSRKHILHWVDSNNRNRRYYPDFYLPEHNIYIDPKNPFKQLKDKEKLDYIKQHHKLIVGNIEECIEQIYPLLA